MPELRPLLFSIAYRMLGSVAEAEDVVQEAFLRRTTVEAPDNERAFMIAVTIRIAIDVLRSARVRREAYVGSWLPEPLVEAEAPRRVEEEESVSIAMLVLLERLTPVERAVFVLRESFDLDYGAIAGIVDRGEDNCRQILSRARRRLEEDARPRFDVDPAEGRALAERFLAAAREGDLDGLVSVLAADVALVGDGGGKARSIARPMVGAAAVARALSSFYGQVERRGVTLEPVWVNGAPGFRTLDADGLLVNVVGLEIAEGRIARVYSMLNPDKLGHLGPTSTLGLRPAIERSS
ncbi:RNA polymerase sigma-70 factor [Candidatus Solirubrobacter pratensis]|uniref:RNA polymerase sigma-70 factor n=1 Tax=Candidatus Solirubrobacter pratensis TaxID=1298857 RepID=UPI0003FDB7E1|nr:RNA polymerase sigma-70 factor [Candidatus Solirubrobacter pratensis]